MTSVIQQQGKTILITVPRKLAVSSGSSLSEVTRLIKNTSANSLLPGGIQIKCESQPVVIPSPTPIMSYIEPNSMKIDFDMLHSTLDIDDSMDEDGPSRKRKRLTHLSPEERLMRRKLKNRVAAQTARDRKKARMDELEIIVQKLEQENSSLSEENSALRTQSESLSEENAQLRRRLNGQNLDGAESEVESRESAALAYPLQRDPIPPQSKYLSKLMTILTTLSLMQFSTSYKTSVQSLAYQNQLKRSIKQLQQRQHQLKHLQVHKSHNKWWGPHQSCWNPSMDL